MEELYKQKLNTYKDSLIKNIISIAVRSVYSEYDMFYIMCRNYGEDLRQLSDSKMDCWYEHGNFHSFEDYVREYAPDHLYNYFVWRHKFEGKNPYQKDWDSSVEGIIDGSIKTIMSCKSVKEDDEKVYQAFSIYGLSFYSEMHHMCQLRETLKDADFAYDVIYDICQVLIYSKKIDKFKLNEILKELETSTNIEETILNILNNGDEIYFAAAFPHMSNLKNKAKSILAFNLIFNPNIEFKGFDLEIDKKIPTKNSVKEALNSGYTLEEIPGIFDYLLDNVLWYYELEEILEAYGINMDMQDEKGNTLIMRFLIKGKGYKKEILTLLKQGFNLTLKNHEGLNTYDVAMKYCIDDEELISIISKIYGVQFDATAKEFYCELSRVRRGLTTKIKSI